MRDGLADHWAEIFGLHVGQVNEGEEVDYVPKSQLAENPHYAQNPSMSVMAFHEKAGRGGGAFFEIKIRKRGSCNDPITTDPDHGTGGFDGKRTTNFL
jgi:hypothetical protein